MVYYKFAVKQYIALPFPKAAIKTSLEYSLFNILFHTLWIKDGIRARVALVITP